MLVHVTRLNWRQADQGGPIEEDIVISTSLIRFAHKMETTSGTILTLTFHYGKQMTIVEGIEEVLASLHPSRVYQNRT